MVQILPDSQNVVVTISLPLLLSCVESHKVQVSGLLFSPLLPLSLVLWKLHVVLSAMQMTRRYAFL